MKMTKILTGIMTLGLLLNSAQVRAAVSAVPMSFTHHGLLWDGDELVNGPISITATLYDGESNIIIETTKDVIVENGFYNLTIDEINPDDIIAANGQMELGIKVGDTAELTPHIPISSVPYAIVAANLSCQGCVTEELLSDDIQSKLNNSGTNSGNSTIANGTITTDMIKDNQITKNKLDETTVLNGSFPNMTVGTATTATKLGSASVGTSATPIWLDKGEPKAISGGIGGSNQPVYIDANGKITAATPYNDATVANATNATNATNAEYAAKIVTSSGIGGTTQPVYVDSSGNIAPASGIYPAKALGQITIKCLATSTCATSNTSSPYTFSTECTEFSYTENFSRNFTKIERQNTGAFEISVPDSLGTNYVVVANNTYGYGYTISSPTENSFRIKFSTDDFIYSSQELDSIVTARNACNLGAARMKAKEFVIYYAVFN